MRTIPLPTPTPGADVNWDPGDRPWDDGLGNDRPWARPGGGGTTGPANPRYLRLTTGEPRRVAEEVRAT
jgi:hypothetical protein